MSIVEQVIEQIKTDLAKNDIADLKRLLSNCDESDLIEYLPLSSKE